MRRARGTVRAGVAAVTAALVIAGTLNANDPGGRLGALVGRLQTKGGHCAAPQYWVQPAKGLNAVSCDNLQLYVFQTQALRAAFERRRAVLLREAVPVDPDVAFVAGRRWLVIAPGPRAAATAHRALGGEEHIVRRVALTQPMMKGAHSEHFPTRATATSSDGMGRMSSRV